MSTCCCARKRIASAPSCKVVVVTPSSLSSASAINEAIERSSSTMSTRQTVSPCHVASSLITKLPHPSLIAVCLGHLLRALLDAARTVPDCFVPSARGNDEAKRTVLGVIAECQPRQWERAGMVRVCIVSTGGVTGTKAPVPPKAHREREIHSPSLPRKQNARGVRGRFTAPHPTRGPFVS